MLFSVFYLGAVCFLRTCITKAEVETLFGKQQGERKKLSAAVYPCADWVNEDRRKPVCGTMPTAPPKNTGIRTDWNLTGQWFRRRGGVEERSCEFRLPSCRSMRYTAAHARAKLKGHHILFVGDSVTRYQYLHFVTFIHTGKWPTRETIFDNKRYGPNVV